MHRARTQDEFVRLLKADGIDASPEAVALAEDGGVEELALAERPLRGGAGLRALAYFPVLVHVVFS